MFAALKVLYREAEHPSISVAYGLFLCPYASFLIWRYLTPRAYIVMVYASLSIRTLSSGLVCGYRFLLSAQMLNNL